MFSLKAAAVASRKRPQCRIIPSQASSRLSPNLHTKGVPREVPARAQIHLLRIEFRFGPKTAAG